MEDLDVWKMFVAHLEKKRSWTTPTLKRIIFEIIISGTIPEEEGTVSAVEGQEPLEGQS